MSETVTLKNNTEENEDTYIMEAIYVPVLTAGTHLCIPTDDQI